MYRYEPPARRCKCHALLLNTRAKTRRQSAQHAPNATPRQRTVSRAAPRPCDGVACADPMGAAGGPTYECHLCGAAATVSCGACGALFYCGEAHRGAHWRDGGHGGAECERMAADVAAAGALRATLPFPWAAAATEAIEAQRDTACAFLERAGVHGVGLWRRECACGTAGPFGACPHMLCALPLACALTLRVAQARCRPATARPRATSSGRCRPATRPAMQRAAATQVATTTRRRSRTTGRRTTRYGACPPPSALRVCLAERLRTSVLSKQGPAA